MTRSPSLSVVIPAHNEERDLARTLSALLADAGPGEFDVVVVPNACSDRTAEIASSFPGVRVVETPRPGKAGALRLGYEHCATEPRLFLDADVRLSADSVRRMLERLAADERTLACSPRVEWDISECGWMARRAHLAHDRLVAPTRGLAGVGAYLLGPDACERIFPIPDIVADDEYVHRSFDDGERVTVAQAVSVTRPASTFGSLVRRRARARFGNLELDALHIRSGAPSLGPGELLRAVRQRRIRAMDAGLFALVVASERLLVAYWRTRRRGAVWSIERTAGAGRGVGG